MATKTVGVELAKWYQIHTNGAGTTFARIYQGHDENGFGCFWFEKMSVDTATHMGYAQIFGRESYTSDLSAEQRLLAAMESSI